MEYSEDIFSMNGITFGSPIGDKQEFTLEELLEEDELLQEVKSANGKLIDFLRQDECISKLVDYIVRSPSPHATDLQVFKYPYMSCEVLCLENSDIVTTLVSVSEGSYVLKLFKLLDSPSPLSNYLAGYFEKVLEMLFRRETKAVMQMINSGGIALFKKFLNHIDNYSIMQIIQRLMLPHIPFTNTTEDGDSAFTQFQRDSSCLWSLSDEYLNLLCDKMLDVGHGEVSAHISDLLITVIQLTLPDSKIISNLSSTDSLNKFLKCAFSKDLQTVDKIPIESVSLAAISVIESLISRLGESLGGGSLGGPDLDQNSNPNPDEFNRLYQFTRQCIENISQVISVYFNDIFNQLQEYVDGTRREDILFQSKKRYPRVGLFGLQLIKLVESLIRLDSTNIEMHLCESKIFKVSIDLMLCFQHNSILHLSIQRILSTIIQCGEKKRSIQHHVLVECDLVKTLVGYITKDYKAENALIAGSKSPLLGHIISIAQVMVSIMQSEAMNRGAAATSEVIDDSNAKDITATSSDFSRLLLSTSHKKLHSQGIDAVEPTCVGEILIASGLDSMWKAFYESILVQYLEKQNNQQLDQKASSSARSEPMIDDGYDSKSFSSLDDTWKFFQNNQDQNQHDLLSGTAGVFQFANFNQFSQAPASDFTSFGFDDDKLFDSPAFANFEQFTSTNTSASKNTNMVFSDSNNDDNIFDTTDNSDQILKNTEDMFANVDCLAGSNVLSEIALNTSNSAQRIDGSNRCDSALAVDDIFGPSFCDVVSAVDFNPASQSGIGISESPL